jgi:5,10-methylene-tetrahydrofolate dehydrogenase/Methenyl tetrahydrofolate cyclohydrolase
MLLDCRPLQESILSRLKTLPQPRAGLCAVLIGNDPASVSFIKQKEKVARDLHIQFSILYIEEGTSEAEVKEK